MYRASTPLQLPSPRFYLFLLPFSLQALLLNDAFAPRFSRLARLALLPITVYLAIRTPKCYGFEPREAWIGPNAVLAMGGLYCAAKGVEWGLARDAREYRWKGFKDTVAGTATGATDGKKEPFERRNDFETRSAPSPSAQSTYSTLVSTLHLITSMRGAGYPYHSTSSRHPLPRYSAPNFLFRTLCNILISHLALTINASIVTLPYTRRLALVSCIVQTLPLVELKGYPLHCLTESLSYVSWGLSAWTGIALFHSLFTLLSLLVFHTLLRLPFDSRSYPPLFERAWAPHGVRYYWAAQWHQLLRRPFHYLAWDPMERAVRLAGGGRRLGKAMGSLAAFGLTAWVHEFGGSFGRLPFSESANFRLLPLRSLSPIVGAHLGPLIHLSASNDLSLPVRLHHLLPPDVAWFGRRNTLHSAYG